MQTVPRGDQDANTAERRAADALALLDAVLADAPSARAILDLDLRCMRVNGRLSAITGLAIEAHLGRTLTDVIGERAAAVEEAARSVLTTSDAPVGVELVTPPAESPDTPHTYRV